MTRRAAIWELVYVLVPIAAATVTAGLAVIDPLQRARRSRRWHLPTNW
jgi:hypothetical protein